MVPTFRSRDASWETTVDNSFLTEPSVEEFGAPLHAAQLSQQSSSCCIVRDRVSDECASNYRKLITPKTETEKNMLTTLIMLSIIAGLFIIASIVDRLLLHSILFPTTVSRAIKGQRDVSEYLDSLAMLDRDGPYVAGHAFDDLMRGHI
jgi:hypothetical protein